MLACRSAPRAAAAIKQIEDTADLSGQPGKLVFAELDLGSLRSVEACARAVIAMPEPLHALICNGGIMAVPFSLTGDGHETQFQVRWRVASGRSTLGRACLDFGCRFLLRSTICRTTT